MSGLILFSDKWTFPAAQIHQMPALLCERRIVLCALTQDSTGSGFTQRREAAKSKHWFISARLFSVSLPHAASRGCARGLAQYSRMRFGSRAVIFRAFLFSLALVLWMGLGSMKPFSNILMMSYDYLRMHPKTCELFIVGIQSIKATPISNYSGDL
jgi:hypothetical protein